MGATTKNITIHYFKIKSETKTLQNINSIFQYNEKNDTRARFFTSRGKNILIKTISNVELVRSKAHFFAAVKERSSWQVKVNSDGVFHGVKPQQGLMGDLYYFLLLPREMMLLGFTTGLNGTIKNIGKLMLEQFSSNRRESMTLDLIPKQKDFAALNEIPEFSSLQFKISTSSLMDVGDDVPELIKNLASAPYIDGSMQLSLDFDLGLNAHAQISRDSIIEIVNYLSENPGCSVLKIKGTDQSGASISLDFGDAFLNYKTAIKLRDDFIDETTALSLLKEAVASSSFNFN
jgi:hypothetical protein